MDRKTGGWVVTIAAFGMLAGLIGADLIQLMHLQETLTPAFMGNILLHVSAVVTAFVGGRLIPDDRTGQMTRSTDKEQK